MTSTRQAAVGNPASLDTLTVVDREVRPPGFGELLVKMQAASLNFHDYAVVTGILGPRAGIVPLSDGAGVVEAVGAGVKDFAKGDHVASLFCPNWDDGPATAEHLSVMAGDTIDGFAAGYVTKPAAHFIHAPKNYAPAESATLSCAALTAWRGLAEAKMKPGDWVVTQGTGGVSIFALQFAKAAGARVVATSSSDEKLETLRALGADQVINYRSTPEWGNAARDITGGTGVDIVIEVGGPATLDQSISAVRVGGYISLIGVLTGFRGEVSTGALMAQNIHLNGITVGSRADYSAMIRAIEATNIRPVISRRFPLEEIAAAFRFQESGAHLGKIILDI
jgi:NADPH:quinone reductase-like Zn-dependent oxidoreductase